MERYGSIESVLWAEIVELGAALDAEREKVKELKEWQRVVVGTGTDQEAVVRMAATEYTKTAVQCWKDENAKLTAQLATLQAQLVRWKEALGEWLWNCTNLLGDYHIKTVQDFNEEVNRRIAWLMEHLDHTLPPPMTDEERDRMQKLSEGNAALQADNECKDSLIETLQAQLRQVEGDRQTLRQLVEALPVVDVQEVSVWLSPDESGWLVSKRPAFPAGLYWAKFRTQAEADSFRALLAYRATLAAKDAPQPAPNERVEYARLELAALFSTPGAPTLEQAKLVCENKNPADAQCILNAYEALREAAQDAGKEAQP